MIYPFEGRFPDIHPSVFLAEGAIVAGDVVLAADVSVWFHAVIRGDVNRIRVGPRTNVQDNCTLHVTWEEAELDVGAEVTIGHGAILHGCTVRDGCLIGMHATVLDLAEIGEECLVAAGSVVLERTRVPAGSLVAGVPARVVRPLGTGERAGIRESSAHYLQYVAQYRAHRDIEAGIDPARYFLRRSGGAP